MTYYAEFTTVLLMALAALRMLQATVAKRLDSLMLRVFAAGFYGTVALIGVSILNRGA